MCLGGPGRETKGRQGVTRPGRTEETGEKPERRIMSGTQNVGVKSTTTTVYSPTVLHNSTAQHAEAQRRSTSQQHIVEAQHSTSGSQDLSGVQAPVQGILLNDRDSLDYSRVWPRGESQCHGFFP